jgi:hypothetical protein
MLYHDVQRAFEGCYVLSRDKHLYGQIGGVSSAERGMFGMEDEVDVYDKNILYHVQGELDGVIVRPDGGVEDCGPGCRIRKQAG